MTRKTKFIHFFTLFTKTTSCLWTECCMVLVLYSLYGVCSTMYLVNSFPNYFKKRIKWNGSVYSVQCTLYTVHCTVWYKCSLDYFKKPWVSLFSSRRCCSSIFLIFLFNSVLDLIVKIWNIKVLQHLVAKYVKLEFEGSNQLFQIKISKF